MRKTSFAIIAIAALAMATTLMAGDGKDGDAVLKKIQGTWRFKAHETGGKPREVAKLTITFTADKWVVEQNGKQIQAGTHKFDTSKKPGHIDAKVTEGEGKGNTMLGIFEFKGDNTMRVCFDPEGKERPTSFEAKEGRLSATVEREKKK